MTIWNKFEKNYQMYLRFYCYKRYKHYDLKFNYNLPSCMINSSLARAHELVKLRQTLHVYDGTRMNGAAAKFLGNVNYTKDGEEMSTDEEQI